MSLIMKIGMEEGRHEVPTLRSFKKMTNDDFFAITSENKKIINANLPTKWLNITILDNGKEITNITNPHFEFFYYSQTSII